MERNMPSSSGITRRTQLMLRRRSAFQRMATQTTSTTSLEVSSCKFSLSILISDGQFYFIKGWHLREFGFPRGNDLKKKFKWKKMNFTTDLPKQDPICSYLVATGKIETECYRMHVVVNSQEYNKIYRKSEVLKHLRSNMDANAAHREKEKQKLLPEDRVANTARVILCHVIRIKDKVKGAHDIKRCRFSMSKAGVVKRSRSRKRQEWSDSDYRDGSSENESDLDEANQSHPKGKALNQINEANENICEFNSREFRRIRRQQLLYTQLLEQE